jgi:hypothetical protein
LMPLLALWHFVPFDFALSGFEALGGPEKP